MKKALIFVMILMLIGSLNACKKDPDKKSTEPATTLETTVAITTEQTTTTTTVTGDVYPGESTEKVEGTIDYSTVQGTLETDDVVKSELKLFVEKVYYNFLFHPSSLEGKITESDMQLFGISYVYQFENQELSFDVNEFILYVPEEQVSAVIKRFFDYEFVNHTYPDEAKISYEDSYYLMPARDETLGAPPAFTQILRISDFSYKVFFDGTTMNESGANVPTKYEVVIEEREGRFIILNYKSIVEQPVTN